MTNTHRDCITFANETARREIVDLIVPTNILFDQSQEKESLNHIRFNGSFFSSLSTNICVFRHEYETNLSEILQ